MAGRISGIAEEQAKGDGALGRERKGRREGETARCSTVGGSAGSHTSVMVWIRRPQNHPI